MRRRNRSILDNATMAESLVRLYLSRRPEFYAEAVQRARVVRRDYKEYGYYVAGYGRAVDLIFYEPLFLTIVGDRDSAEAVELRRTALSTYVPSRIVQTLDPEAHDPILLGHRWTMRDAHGAVIAAGGFDPARICLDPTHVGRGPHMEGDVTIPHVDHTNLKVPDLVGFDRLEFTRLVNGVEQPFGVASRRAFSLR
jgi:hypothetical protein